MLLDWPEQKRPLRDHLHKTIGSLARGGVVSQVPSLTLYEGNRAVFIYPDGQVQELQLKSVEAKTTLDGPNLGTRGPELVANAMRELAGGIGEKMEKDLVQLMQQANARHGGKFGGEDEETMFEDLMRGLREMDMSFDEDGRPSIFFVARPENAAKLQALNTPERQKLFDELIEKKRSEWLRVESQRRLVD